MWSLMWMWMRTSRCWTVVGRRHGLDIYDLRADFLINKATEAQKRWRASGTPLLADTHRSPPFCCCGYWRRQWRDAGVGCMSVTGQAKWGVFTTESLLLEMMLPLSFFALVWRLESPQIVLLGAGAFPQGDVVHGHLADSASPALPLQDHLGNSRKAHNRCQLHHLKLRCDLKPPVTLTLSSPVPHSVIWVCLQPFPPVRPHTAGLSCFPFFTNTCSMPTWWPASLCRNDRHRLPSFQGCVSGRTSWAPRPVLLLLTSGMVRYRPPVVVENSDRLLEK